MIGPVGWGTPPRGSMVTAKFWAAGRPGRPFDSKRARPEASASKTPAATGLPSAKTHSSYCLSGGSGTRLPATMTPVFAFSLQKTFARAEGCGSFPPRKRIRTSSLSSTRTRRSRRAISVRAPESSAESWAAWLRRSSLCRRSRASSQTAKTKRTAAAAASHQAARETEGTAGARSKREPGREARIFSRSSGRGSRGGTPTERALAAARNSGSSSSQSGHPSSRCRASSLDSSPSGRPRAWRAASSSSLSLCAMALTLSIRGNALAKFHQAQTHPSLDRSQRSRRPLRDLLVRQAFEVRQLERPPLFLRQLGNGRAALSLPFPSSRIRLEVLPRRRLRGLLEAPDSGAPARPAGPQPVDGSAPSRHEQPREHRSAGGIEGRGRFPDVEEDLLKDLLRFSRVSENSLGKAEQPRGMPVIEERQRVGVTALDPGDESAVVVP